MMMSNAKAGGSQASNAPGLVAALRREIPRFIASGLVVTATNFLIMTVLVLIGVPAQISLVCAVVGSTAVHFALNRQWVFMRDAGYAHHLSVQGRRYLAVVVVNYAVSSAAIAFLPALLGWPVLVVYFATNIVMAAILFPVLRMWVFTR